MVFLDKLTHKHEGEMAKLFGKEIIFALEHLLACDVMKEQVMEFIHLLMKVEEKDRQKH